MGVLMTVSMAAETRKDVSAGRDTLAAPAVYPAIRTLCFNQTVGRAVKKMPPVRQGRNGQAAG